MKLQRFFKLLENYIFDTAPSCMPMSILHQEISIFQPLFYSIVKVIAALVMHDQFDTRSLS